MTQPNELLHFDNPVEYITTHLEDPMSIEASAGCGKTYALIARACQLLASGRTTIDRLLLLTFTENAAAEMKSRLVEILHEQHNQEWAQTALENMHTSSIQTLHSFAYDICKQFHDSLGLPDGIVIVDAFDEQRFLQSFFNRRYNAWGNDGEMLVLFQLFRAFGLTRKSLYSAFRLITGKLSYLPGDTTTHDRLPLEDVMNHLSRATRSLQEKSENILEMRTQLNENALTEKQLQRVDSFCELAWSIAHSENQADIASSMLTPEQFIKGKKFSITIAKTFSEEYVEMESAIAAMGEVIEEHKPRLIDSVLQLISNWLHELAIEYRDMTFSSGRITFDDSIIAARRALDTESIRDQVWGKFDCIIVDEFQDTDVHQLAIIDALADDASEGDLARMFVVGDDKQSIYGFRGATVDGYKEFIHTRPLTRVALSTSRRSVPAVVDVINTISESLLDDYVPMSTTRTDLDTADHYHVKVLGAEVEGSKDDAREHQARDIVATLTDMRGTSLIYDKKRDETRPCDYSDMTILIRDKNSLGPITHALDERGVPYSVDSSALVWELTMIRVFLAIMNALVKPRDAFAVIGALKTPLFCLTNDDLARYVRSQRSSQSIWDYRNTVPDPENDVSQAMSTLHELSRALSFLTPTQCVHHILFEMPFFQSFSVSCGLSHATSVARFLTSNVIAWENAHPLGSVADYIEHITHHRKNSIKSDTSIDSGEHNRVRIMTIHASKGLEFPIVGFAASHSESRDRGIKVIDIDGEFMISVSSKIFDSRLADYKDELRDRFLEEESRLTYVALTRAMDHLIIADHHKKSKSAHNQAAKIYEATQHIERYPLTYEIDDPTPKIRDEHNDKNALGEISSHTDSEYTQRIIARQHLQKSITSTIAVSATAIKPEKFVTSVNKHQRLSFLSQSAAPSIGIAVHRALNIIDFSADAENIENICRRCASNEGIVNDRDVGLCIDMVTRALSLPVLHSAYSAMREVPISGYIGDVFCEGYIDCLVHTPHGYLIIDYKTDTIDATRPLESKVQLHAFQLAFYSLLVKSTFNTDACSAALLFLNHDEMPYVEINDLEMHEQLVREQLSAHFASG